MPEKTEQSKNPRSQDWFSRIARSTFSSYRGVKIPEDWPIRGGKYIKPEPINKKTTS